MIAEFFARQIVFSIFDEKIFLMILARQTEKMLFDELNPANGFSVHDDFLCIQTSV